jgi:putative DNA primase/helicase
MAATTGSGNSGTAPGTGSGPATPASAGNGDRNSVGKAKSRARKAAPDAAEEQARSARVGKTVNSISLPRVRVATARKASEAENSQERRERDAAAEKRAGKPSAASPSESRPESPREDLDTVPEHIRRRFVQVGRKYFFPDGARAFTDRGRRLTTPSENTEVIRSLVTIAQARGWNEIVVRGTDQFRREAWFAARLMGLEVRGYRPTEVEQARLVRTMASRQAQGEPGPAEAKPPQDKARSPRKRGAKGSDTDLIIGRLLEHGVAPFQQDPHESMSYFAKIQTPTGERVVWGVDLERAFAESLTRPQVGDEIGLRFVDRKPVTVKTAKRDRAGKVVGQTDLDTHRNRWVVEKREFFERRTAAAETVRNAQVDPREAVKSHPELVGTYLQIRAAELAAKNIKDPKDRERFVSTVRSALAETVARGEPAPRVKMRERTASRPPVRTRVERNAEQATGRS